MVEKLKNASPTKKEKARKFLTLYLFRISKDVWGYVTL